MILCDKFYAGFFFSLFVDRGDLAYFDGLSETILAVGLVKPKGGKEYMAVAKLRQLLNLLYKFFCICICENLWFVCVYIGMHRIHGFVSVLETLRNQLQAKNNI